MNTADTTPIPLFENEESFSPQNRLASLLGGELPPSTGLQDLSTEWHQFRLPFQSIYAKASACDELSEVRVACFLWARVAEANNDISRPLGGNMLLMVDTCHIQDASKGSWALQVKTTLDRLAEKCEEERAKPEFVWSKALYKARKAAVEFSKDTYADR